MFSFLIIKNIEIFCNFIWYVLKTTSYTGFSIKNINVLNSHNFRPERRTEIEKKKKFEVRSIDLVYILTKFCKVIKIRGYVT